jgi:hypothetical protein
MVVFCGVRQLCHARIVAPEPRRNICQMADAAARIIDGPRLICSGSAPLVARRKQGSRTVAVVVDRAAHARPIGFG